MSKGRILVVDDEDIVRTSCSRTLVPEGYEVTLVKNGFDGLALLEKDPVVLRSCAGSRKSGHRLK
jgi:CheY-like chemotaxis protein